MGNMQSLQVLKKPSEEVEMRTPQRTKSAPPRPFFVLESPNPSQTVAPPASPAKPPTTLERISKHTFLSLPVEIREEIYRCYLHLHRRSFTFDRKGQRYFLPSDPAVPEGMSLLKVPALRRELLSILYRESECHVSVWPHQLTRKNGLGFSNLALDGRDRDCGKKLALFPRIRFSLAEAVDVTLSQQQGILRVERLTLALYPNLLRYGIPHPSKQAPDEHYTYMAHFSRRIHAQLYEMGAFTPRKLEAFVWFLCALLLEMKEFDPAVESRVVNLRMVKRTGSLNSKEVKRVKELMAVKSDLQRCLTVEGRGIGGEILVY